MREIMDAGHKIYAAALEDTCANVAALRGRT
jgi:hypothetical protein